MQRAIQVQNKPTVLNDVCVLHHAAILGTKTWFSEIWEVRFEFHVKWELHWTYAVWDRIQLRYISADTSQLVSWSQVFEKLTIVQLMKNFSFFNDTRRFKVQDRVLSSFGRI